MSAPPQPRDAHSRIGERLLERGLVREADLQQALDLQKRLGGRLGGLLVRIGAISEDPLVDALSEQLDLPLLGRDITAPPPDALRLPDGLGTDWLLDAKALVWEADDGRLHCASRDPLSPTLQEVLEHAFKRREIVWVLATAASLDRCMEAVAALGRAEAGLPDDNRALRELAEEAPVVELVNNLLSQAVEQRASDIHLEPEEREFAVRFRIDGVLYTRLRLVRGRFDAVASRVKLISGMDIAERRLPQDGRLSTRVGGQAMDIRASALPGVHGESIVMRLLPKERKDLGLDRLGMYADQLELLQSWAREAHGIVLVTGPTGSGKSTTLYATLAASNDGLRKIITVEDPVEFQLPGVTQIQTHADIGLTFASALRSILRQDPDVIMVGEIRDRETAEIAIQSALTGHLVLSTVHTNDALGAFTRLIDMGVEPFLVATPIKGVQAQRLVRRLCEACAVPAPPPAAALLEEAAPAAKAVLGDVAPRWMQARGCSRCQHTGYRGRFGIYEMIPVDEAMQQAVVGGASHAELKAMAAAQGHRSLRTDGLLKAWEGLTSVDEILRVTGT